MCIITIYCHTCTCTCTNVKGIIYLHDCTCIYVCICMHMQSEKATELTHLVLNYDPRDALVLCCVLRCMLSGLLWVLDLDPNTLLQPYLQKVYLWLPVSVHVHVCIYITYLYTTYYMYIAHQCNTHTMYMYSSSKKVYTVKSSTKMYIHVFCSGKNQKISCSTYISLVPTRHTPAMNEWPGSYRSRLRVISKCIQAREGVNYVDMVAHLVLWHI